MSEPWREWPVLVRRKQVMETGLSRRDLERLVEQGRLHPVRVTGRYAKYRRDELVQVLTEAMTPLTATTTVFKGDFGTVEMIPSSFMGGTTVGGEATSE